MVPFLFHMRQQWLNGIGRRERRKVRNLKSGSCEAGGREEARLVCKCKSGGGSGPSAIRPGRVRRAFHNWPKYLQVDGVVGLQS